MAKTLILYYSLSGNVDFIAKELSKELKADLFRVETAKEYPKTGFSSYFHGGKDALFNATPELKTPLVDLSAYDTIVIGTPVWASKPAAPINTVLSIADFSGKKVAVFASSAGGSSAKTLEIVASKVKNATVSEMEAFKNPLKNTEFALEQIKAFAEKLAH